MSRKQALHSHASLPRSHDGTTKRAVIEGASDQNAIPSKNRYTTARLYDKLKPRLSLKSRWSASPVFVRVALVTFGPSSPLLPDVLDFEHLSRVGLGRFAFGVDQHKRRHISRPKGACSPRRLFAAIALFVLLWLRRIPNHRSG